MIAYFDSSALVKLLVEEAGSEHAAALWDAADLVVTSRVASPEVRAAIASAHRARRLDDQQLSEAKSLWSTFASALRMVELTDDVAERAGDLAEAHALSGFDAVHLSSALVLAGPETVVATWDLRLHAAAVGMGVRTLPATL